jgi:hypothetical protein
MVRQTETLEKNMELADIPGTSPQAEAAPPGMEVFMRARLCPIPEETHEENFTIQVQRDNVLSEHKMLQLRS